jgi:hypothetical protein
MNILAQAQPYTQDLRTGLKINKYLPMKKFINELSPPPFGGGHSALGNTDFPVVGGYIALQAFIPQFLWQGIF